MPALDYRLHFLCMRPKDAFLNASQELLTFFLRHKLNIKNVKHHLKSHVNTSFLLSIGKCCEFITKLQAFISRHHPLLSINDDAYVCKDDFFLLNNLISTCSTTRF